MLKRSRSSSNLDATIFQSKKPVKETKSRGYSPNRFENKVPDMMICKYCEKVAKNPIRCDNCESLGCKDCIENDIRAYFVTNRSYKCKRCEKIVQVKSVSNSFNKALGKFTIRCKFEGCSQILKVKNIEEHEISCDFKVINCNATGCRYSGATKNFIKTKFLPPWMSDERYAKVRYACSSRCLSMIQFQESVVFYDKATVLNMYYSLLTKLYK